MQTTSEVYKRIISGEHWFNVSVAFGEPGRLITEKNETILFGGTAILVARSGADGGYDQSMLKSVKITRQIFSGNSPEIGKCVASEIDVEMLVPSAELPPMAQIVPYVRARNNTEVSEWLQKGVYYIDTRDKSKGQYPQTLKIHGFDAMLTAEQDYPSTTDITYPAPDVTVVKIIADTMGVAVDDRTWELMTRRYMVQYPGTLYNCREILGYIAAMYCGNWTLTDLNELLLVPINSIPRETQYLIDHVGYALTFGGDRILV